MHAVLVKVPCVQGIALCKGLELMQALNEGIRIVIGAASDGAGQERREG